MQYENPMGTKREKMLRDLQTQLILSRPSVKLPSLRKIKDLKWEDVKKKLEKEYVKLKTRKKPDTSTISPQILPNIIEKLGNITSDNDLKEIIKQAREGLEK